MQGYAKICLTSEILAGVYGIDVLPHKRASTVPDQERQLRWWKVRLGYYALADITPALIAECRDTLRRGKGKRRANATRDAFEGAVERAGIEDFRLHDLRHTFASYLAMHDATLAEIAEALGHKTLAMVKRYAHLSESHTRSVVQRMNTAIFGE